MKKTILLFSFLAFIGFVEVMGQEAASKIHKVGVNFSNPDNFGVRYYTGTEKALWRFTALNGGMSYSNASYDDSLFNKRHNARIGFGFGFQKNKLIRENMTFFYGLDVLNYYSYSKYSGKTWAITSGLGFVLGLKYNLSDDFDISVELSPSFRYSYYETIPDEPGFRVVKDNAYIFGLDNNGASFTLAYRF